MIIIYEKINKILAIEILNQHIKLLIKFLEIIAARRLRKKRVRFERYSEVIDFKISILAASTPRMLTWVCGLSFEIFKNSKTALTRKPGTLADTLLTAKDPTSPKMATANMSRIPRNAYTRTKEKAFNRSLGFRTLRARLATKKVLIIEKL